MRSHHWHSHLTPGRRAWLAKLAAEGVADRPAGNVGYVCMRLGWTTWLYERNGERATHNELIARIRASEPVVWREWRNIGEVLTDAGRKVLEGVE